jgi:hypothetical protein
MVGLRADGLVAGRWDQQCRVIGVKEYILRWVGDRGIMAVKIHSMVGFVVK